MTETVPAPDPAAADERLRPRFGQVLLAVLVIGLVAGLAVTGFTQAAEVRARSDALAGSEATRTNIVYTMRESLALSVVVERYLAGTATRREVQVARALLGQRLGVVSSDGVTAGDAAPASYRDALFALDAYLLRLPPGELTTPTDQAMWESQLHPVITDFTRESRHLGDLESVTWRAESRAEADRFYSASAWEAGLLALAMLLALALVLWLIRDLRAYRRRVHRAISEERVGLDEARAALARAALLERGQARVLERLATGAPLHEQLGSVVELASQATGGLPFRLLVADRVVLSESAQVRVPGATLLATWPIGDGSVAAESGELELFGDDTAPVTPETEVVAQQCCDLASLVLEHDRAAALLEYQANHDALTGLPNRALLLDRIGEAMRRRERSGEVVAVLFCDLDRFKTVNDTLGHEAGDDVLLAVAGRFREAVRLHDTVARLGGDEFVVLATWMNEVSEVDALVERLRACLDEPIPVRGREVSVGVSIGVAVVDDFMTDAKSALHAADVAMYRGKTRPVQA